MGLCLGTCSICIKTQTKRAQPAGCALLRLSLVVLCPPTQRLLSCCHVAVMSSLSLSLCHGQHASPSSSSLCHLIVVYPVVVVSCCTPSSSCHVVPMVVVSYRTPSSGHVMSSSLYSSSSVCPSSLGLVVVAFAKPAWWSVVVIVVP